MTSLRLVGKERSDSMLNVCSEQVLLFHQELADLGYALEVARENDIPLPLTSGGHELYKAGRRAAGPEENCPEAVMRYWQRLCSER